ncbi:MAG TPA: hypothetical protein VIT23_05320 [Terrimicrobiaceae bacterium]
MSGSDLRRCAPAHLGRRLDAAAQWADQPAPRPDPADPDRGHLHFISTSSSWLNLVEGFFGEITAKVIRPGSFRSVGALVADIFRFLDHHNLNPKPYRWTADPKRILEKLDRAWEALLEEIYNPVYGTSH